MDKENIRKIIKIASLSLGIILFIALIVYLAVIGARKPSFPDISLAPSVETSEDEPTLPPDGVVVEGKTVMESQKEYYADLNDNGYYEQIIVNKRSLEYMPDIATLYINGVEVFQSSNIKELVIENPFGWERGWIIGMAVYEEGLPEGYLRYRLYEYTRENDFIPITRDLERMEDVGGEAIPIIASAEQIISSAPTFTRNEKTLNMMLYLDMPEIFYVEFSAEDIDPLSFYIQEPRDGQTVYLHYASTEWPTLKSSRVERRLKAFQAVYDKMDITSNRRILPIGERYQIVKLFFVDDISTKQSEWNGQQTWFQLALADGTYVFILAQNLWKDIQMEEKTEETTEATTGEGGEDVTVDGSLPEDGSEANAGEPVTDENGNVVTNEETADPNEETADPNAQPVDPNEQV